MSATSRRSSPTVDCTATPSWQAAKRSRESATRRSRLVAWRGGSTSRTSRLLATSCRSTSVLASVMLYLIHRGHIGWKGGESEVLHLVTRVSRIGTSGCVFTDTNAATSYHQAHTNLALLSSIIDWSAMPLIDWSAAKAARQAEFLVPRFVPWYTFDRIIVRSNSNRADRQRGAPLEREPTPRDDRSRVVLLVNHDRASPR